MPFRRSISEITHFVLSFLQWIVPYTIWRRFLHELIVPSALSNINNSIELVQKLKNVKIDHGYSLILLDVSLFINIPIDLSIEFIQQMELYRVELLLKTNSQSLYS